MLLNMFYEAPTTPMANFLKIGAKFQHIHLMDPCNQ